MEQKTVGAQTRRLRTCPSVLSFAAVGGRFEGEGPLREKVRDDLMPEPAEVARHDEVIVFGFCPRVAKERAQRVIGGGGHRRAHVVCVSDALVDDFPGCHVCDIGPLALAREEAATAACGRPLRGRRALRAVGHRHAVLPLGGAELRGGQRRDARGIPAVEVHAAATLKPVFLSPLVTDVSEAVLLALVSLRYVGTILELFDHLCTLVCGNAIVEMCVSLSVVEVSLSDTDKREIGITLQFLKSRT